ncbi:MAG: DUF6701 domain-containing protein [Burkholderiales bacterium]
MRALLRCLVVSLSLCMGSALAATYSYQPTTYAWESVGTVAAWTAGNADDGTMVANLGFTFTFGGVAYTQARISTNGFVHFGANQTVENLYPNAGLPANTMDRFIAPYWDDLDVRTVGNVLYGTLGAAPNRRFVVTWNNIGHYSAAGIYAVQLILNENGTFKFQYGAGAATGTSATIGVEVSPSDFTEYSFNSVTVGNGVALLFFTGPMAEYGMEQATWSGAGSILDTSGNGNNASPVGTMTTLVAAPATPPGTCRAANVASNATTGAINAIDTAIDVDTRMRRSGTISFWYRLPTAWTATGDRELLDATTASASAFSLFKRANGSLRFTLTDAANSTVTATTSNLAFAANTWVHIAVTWSYGINARARIYVNGVQQVNQNTSTSSLNAGISTLYIGDNRSAATGGFGTPNAADGQIDEVRIYTNERTAAEITADMNAARACASVVNDYAITLPGGATGLTCEPSQVTFTARDISGTPINPPSGTVLTLTTSTNTGVWLTPLVSGTGAWTVSGSNNGQSSYTWPGTASSFTAQLRHSSAATVNINVLDSGSRVEAPVADPSITFTNSAFRVTTNGTTPATIGTHIAGKDSNAGFGAQTLFLQAIRTDTNTGSCTTVFQNQTVSVELASQCNNPSACTPSPGTPVRILNNASAMVSIAQNNGGGAPTGYTSVSLAFDAQSKAPLVFNYADAGQLTLHARYALPTPPAAQFVTGSSSAFVVRPFGLKIAVSGPGTGLSGPAITPTIVAGNNFTTTLTAVAWKPGDDLDADGQPDSHAQIAANSATPNFGNELAAAAAIVSHNLAEPVGGNAGGLTGTTFSAFANGVRAQTMTFSEVGIINMLASSTSYLGTGQDITASAGGLTGVGRFIPNAFALSATALANRSAAACGPASTFTYMNEGLGLQFTLTAQNASGATTTNYRGTFARLALDPASLAIGARDTAGGTALSTRLDTGAGVTGNWSNGVAAGVIATVAIKRKMPLDDPDGPFTQVRFGIAPLDPDNVTLPAAALDFDVDGVGGNDRAQIGATTQIRFGRLRVSNALGSEKLALPIPMQVEYWSGSGFSVNALDSCTTLPRSSLAMSGYQLNLAACETALDTASINFSNGLAAPSLTASGAGNNGSVDLQVRLGAAGSGQYCPAVGASPLAVTSAARSYLLGRWNSTDDDSDPNTQYDDAPTSRASFGIYGPDRTSNRIIYMRENY